MDNTKYLVNGYLDGNVVKSEVTDMGDIRLYYIESGQRYTVTISANRDGDLYASKKTPAPYAIYTFNRENEPLQELVQVFEYEIPRYIELWGNKVSLTESTKEEWVERIINGDRFYGGAITNQAALMRRVIR